MTPVSKSFFSEFYATFRCTAVQFVMLITARRSAVADKARHASVQSSVTRDMTKVFKILTDNYIWCILCMTGSLLNKTGQLSVLALILTQGLIT